MRVLIIDILVYNGCVEFSPMEKSSNPHDAVAIRYRLTTTRTRGALQRSFTFIRAHPFVNTCLVIRMIAFQNTIVGSPRFNRLALAVVNGLGGFQTNRTKDKIVHSKVGARQNIISPRLATLYLNINGKFCFK